MQKTGLFDRDRQLALSLPQGAPRYDREAFLISDANETACRSAIAWARSDEPALIICGPHGAGKTHLAHIAAGETKLPTHKTSADNVANAPKSGLVVIDGLPALEPRAFLATIEEMMSAGARLLLVGSGHPAEWSKDLKDLRTRLEALPRATLGELDEQLIRAVIAKGFKDRQITVNPAVITYAAPRLPRTFSAAHGFVAAADRAALEENRKITTQFIQKIIDRLCDEPEKE